MIKVLVLTRYDVLGASSRMRFFQFSSQLLNHNISLSFSPLFSNEYITSLQNGENRSKFIIISYFKRFFNIYNSLYSNNINVVWIEKELFPWVPYLIEQFFWPKNIPVILDYDDAVFHTYDKNKNSLIRFFFGLKHKKMMNDANIIFAGNTYLKNYAVNAGAKNFKIIPTVIDLSRYSIIKSIPKIKRPCIGWIGQRSTSKYLNFLVPLLKDLHSNEICDINTIGYDFKNSGFQYTVWSESTEVADISRFDIGIMPLIDDHFERGKCGYKLIQYMACGIPVIASPVGVNCEIVEHGVNGFLASTIDEWKDAINRLISDHDLRMRMGSAGRALVEKKYNSSLVADDIAKYIYLCARNFNQ